MLEAKEKRPYIGLLQSIFSLHIAFSLTTSLIICSKVICSAAKVTFPFSKEAILAKA